MTLKELLDQKRAVVGKRFLIISDKKYNTLMEVVIKEVSGTKNFIKLENGSGTKAWWQSSENFDKSNKIIEILKG